MVFGLLDFFLRKRDNWLNIWDNSQITVIMPLGCPWLSMTANNTILPFGRPGPSTLDYLGQRTKVFPLLDRKICLGEKIGNLKVRSDIP